MESVVMRADKNGFTLLELMTVVAIIGILAGIGIPTFLHFRTKAFAADIVATHEDLQEVVYAEAASLSTNDCQEIATYISDKYFTGHAADLQFGTVTIPGGKGYRPVLLVQAEKNVNGGTGVKAARIAYDVFESENVIDQDTSLTLKKDVVAYSADLIKGDTPICTEHPLLKPTYAAAGKTPAAAPAKTPSSSATSGGPAATGSTSTGSTPTGSASGSPPLPPPPTGPGPGSSQASYDPGKPPAKNNNPCPNGKILSPIQGKPFDETVASGKCVEPPKKATTDPDWNPYGDTTCQVCSGPPQICLRLHHPTTCKWPNNICMNRVVNKPSGAKEVYRSCTNAETAYREWYLGSSDSDRCQTFQNGNVYTLDFECYFACLDDNCNTPLSPIDPNFYLSTDQKNELMYLP
jgi:prepilin-type N-terminal cleavage/methylation domain-containing protein